MSEDYDRSVFINCPFSPDYADFLHVYMFTALYCNVRPRCTREYDNAADDRIDNIVKLIQECRYSIHDLSFVELDEQSNLPRLNMPFELGLFMGAIRFGGEHHKTKSFVMLDNVEHDSKKALSDLAGKDPKFHERNLQKAVTAVRDWLATEVRADLLHSGKLIYEAYNRFVFDLPALALRFRQDADNLIYIDRLSLMNSWLAENVQPPK